MDPPIARVAGIDQDREQGQAAAPAAAGRSIAAARGLLTAYRRGLARSPALPVNSNAIRFVNAALLGSFL